MEFGLNSRQRERPRWILQQSVLIWQRRCSRFTVLMVRGEWYCGGSCAAGRCWRSSPDCHPVLSAWRPAPLRTIGLGKLQALGHKVRLIPPQYVRPFVKTSKNDAADAEAICEAVTRPTMRFAPAKSAEQQSVMMLHRARELLVRQRTMVINALRGHCAELGLIVAQGASKVEELVAIIEDPGDERLPPLAREALGSLVEQLCSAQARIKQLEATLMAWHRSNQASRRLATIPGVGVITATALVATIGDGAQFRSGRHLSAWLGLVPRQHSSGGKDRLGRISKRGDGYIRRLLVHGARSVLRWRRAKPGTRPGWSDQLLARRPTNVVLVAMANKTARVGLGTAQIRAYLPTDARLTRWDKRAPTCEGNDDLMAKQGSTRDRPNPRHCPSIKLVSLTGRRSLGFHQGQRSVYRSEKAGYMTASSTAVSNRFSPCNTGGVHT